MNKELNTKHLTVRKILLSDAVALRDYSLRNRENFRQWEPFRPDEFFSLEETAVRIKNMEQKMFEGVAAHFVILASDIFIGCCNLTNIIRGPFQACHLGFSIDKNWQGKGLMFEALTAILRHTFDDLGLHRIMANYKPDNIRSANLLSKLQFEREGYAKAYLKINGEWADHVLTSLIAPIAERDLAGNPLE